LCATETSGPGRSLQFAVVLHGDMGSGVAGLPIECRLFCYLFQGRRRDPPRWSEGKRSSSLRILGEDDGTSIFITSQSVHICTVPYSEEIVLPKSKLERCTCEVHSDECSRSRLMRR
jgi:hypothetical protein